MSYPDTTESDPKPNYDYFIYDTETTGLNVESDRIVEISGLHLASGERFHCYINPGGKGELGGTDFHGITREKLKEEGALNSKKSLTNFFTWIYTKAVPGSLICLIAHNNFCYDQLILENELVRAGMEIGNWFHADTYPLFKDLGNFSSLKLINIYKKLFKKEFAGAHTADADVTALRDCLVAVHGWQDRILNYIRCSTTIMDDKSYDWVSWMLNKAQLSDLELYGYDSLAKLIQCQAIYYSSFSTLLNSLLGKWIGGKIRVQVTHIVKHQQKRTPHLYSTRSKRFV